MKILLLLALLISGCPKYQIKIKILPQKEFVQNENLINNIRSTLNPNEKLIKIEDKNYIYFENRENDGNIFRPRLGVNRLPRWMREDF